MSKYEKIPLNHFTTDLINAAKSEIWSNPETADDFETLGILVSKFAEWEGEPIIKAFLAALEDANFHSLAEKIETLSNNYFEEAA